jgi:hypothetical protein
MIDINIKNKSNLKLLVMANYRGLRFKPGHNKSFINTLHY